jgi:hypothetical protein
VRTRHKRTTRIVTQEGLKYGFIIVSAAEIQKLEGTIHFIKGKYFINFANWKIQDKGFFFLKELEENGIVKAIKDRYFYFKILWNDKGIKR